MVPTRPRPACGAGNVEVDEHDLAIGSAHQVCRFHIAVDDRWFVVMQVIEHVGDDREIVGDVGDRQSRVSLFLEQLLQIGPVDPVHDDDVAVAVVREEVAAHDGKCADVERCS